MVNIINPLLSPNCGASVVDHKYYEYMQTTTWTSQEDSKCPAENRPWVGPSWGFLSRTWRQSSQNSLGLSSNENMNHRAMFGVILWAVLPTIPEIPRCKSNYVNNNNYVNIVNGKKHSVVRFKQGYVSKPPESWRPKFVFRRSWRQRLLFSVKMY